MTWTVEKGSNLEQTLCDTLVQTALKTGKPKAVLLGERYPGISYDCQVGDVGGCKISYVVGDEQEPGKLAIRRTHQLYMNGKRMAWYTQDYALSESTQSMNRDTTAQSK